MDKQLNEKRSLVLVEMTRGELTHWVLVHRGQGDGPEDYTMNDPLYLCGANRLLSERSSRWSPSRMMVYDPTTPCVGFISPQPPCASLAATARPVPYASTTSIGTDADIYEQPAATSVISGSIQLFSATAVTTTVAVTATSTAAPVTEMLIWSDTVTNTNWQEFYPLVWIPSQDTVYARFRDSLGNTTDVYSATLLVSGPPLEPWAVFLPLLRR